jgi:hypothetical protein
VILLGTVAILRISFTQNRDRLISENIGKAGNLNTDTFVTRFSTIEKAELALTGNTVMLSPTLESTQDGIKDYGAVFTSLDTNSEVSGYPLGTTTEWRDNGSTNYLEILPNSEVLYALLVWGGTYESMNSTIEDDITSVVTLINPGNDQLIEPDPTYSYTFSRESNVRNISQGYYINTQVVTDIVQENGSGTYGISGIPAVIDTPYPSLKNTLVSPDTMAGWSLIVAYKNTSLPVKHVEIQNGIKTARSSIAQNDALTISRVADQLQSPSDAQLHLVASEGDSNLTGDQILFGGPRTGLQPLESVLNKRNNFFASQIVTPSGLHDDRATFGNLNSLIGQTENLKRQGWDVTSIDISDTIRYNQSVFNLLPFSERDGYSLHVVGFDVAIDSANITYSLQEREDILEITINNTGSLPAEELKLSLPEEIESNWLEIIRSISDYPEDKLLISPRITEIEDIPGNSSFTFSAEKSLLMNTIIPYSYSYIDSDNVTIDIDSTFPIISDSFLEDSTVFINRPPQVFDDIAFTKVNEPVTVNILKNDYDLDGGLDPETLIISSNPSEGTAQIVDSNLVYTPKTGYSGMDRIVYQICDFDNSCVNGNVVISVESLLEDEDFISKSRYLVGTITSILSMSIEAAKDQFSGISVNAQTTDLSQKLNSDTAQAISGKQQLIQVLDNDNINSTSEYTMSVVKAPENGIISIEDNILVYTSKDEFIGNDYLIYSLCDVNNTCNTAPVTISVISQAETLQNQVAVNLVSPISGFELSTSLLISLVIIVSIFITYSLTLYKIQESTELAIIENQHTLTIHDK